MAYEVLARKWRPQKFADVVGQEQITKTLQSELLQSKLAHAYLFVGSRGIGKTTIARIFAKAMNCERAPIAEPCCECDSCKSIAASNCIDLIEIDGASNNSVDNIRNICEEVLYAPINARYKVYIIDEVHMLSASAWNSLLKTIEEPPAHAKFMFATTEAHKVLPTVVSRCQRFDLRRITFTSISDQLKKIASVEGISISDAAIEVIARAADGGMRDAQSLLDQMIAFSSSDQGEITEEQTLTVFGLTGVAEMEHLLNSILLDDRPGLITSIHKIASHGKDLEKLFEDILAFLRGIHVCMLMPNPETVLETGVDMIATYKKVGAITNTKVVHKMLEQLSPVGRMLHDALNKQIFIEMILLKSMRVAHSVEIEDLLARLNQIRGNGELKILETMPPTAPKQEELKPVVTTDPIKEIPQSKPQPVVQASVSETPVSVAPISPAPATSTAIETPTPQPATQAAPAASIAKPLTSPVTPPSPLVQPSAPVTPPPNANANLTATTPAPAPEAAPPMKWPTPPTSQPTIEPAKPAPQNAIAQQQKNAAPAQYQAPAVAPVLEVNENRDPFAVAAPPQNAPQTTAPALSAPPSTPTLPTQTPATPALDPFATEADKEPLLLSNPVGNKLVPKPKASKPDTPIAVWHALTLEMERCEQPLLKAYMKEGTPKSYEGGVLSVTFDEEFDSLHAAALLKQKALLETCLRRLTDNKSATLNILQTSGIASPHEINIIDDSVKDEIKSRAENNPFVQGVMNLFEGEIVDVRG